MRKPKTQSYCFRGFQGWFGQTVAGRFGTPTLFSKRFWFWALDSYVTFLNIYIVLFKWSHPPLIAIDTKVADVQGQCSAVYIECLMMIIYLWWIGMCMFIISVMTVWIFSINSTCCWGVMIVVCNTIIILHHATTTTTSRSNIY